MRILMLGWELPPHNSGGLGVACYHMSKALAIAGATIDFVLPYAAHHPDTNFMKVHAATQLDPLYKTGNGAYTSMCHTCGGSDCEHVTHADIAQIQDQYVKFVKHMVIEQPPDVIHAHDWLTMKAGIEAKSISGSPLVVHVHATEFDRSADVSGNPIVHEIENEGLHMADRIIAVSNHTKNIVVQKYGIPSDKIEVIYNSFDESSLLPYVYDRSTYTYLESLKNEGFTIVATLGRLTIQKGLTYYLKAAARALEKQPRLLFLIAGDGEQRDELIELSATLGISDKVFFTGFVRGQQWRDVYSLADAFVMSSVSEPFGLTALEAAAHDTALLISRQSGVGEVLRSVLRFDFWDTDKLADELVGLSSSPSLASELKQNVKKEFDRISWHDVANSCMQQYSRVQRLPA